MYLIFNSILIQLVLNNSLPQGCFDSRKWLITNMIEDVQSKISYVWQLAKCCSHTL